MTKFWRKSGWISLWIVLGVGIADLTYRYGFELLAVPTSSMEDTINPGEYVWVNKLVPGPRIFSNNPSLYRRWEILDSLKRNNIVVFNFPESDTVIADRPDESYYMLKRELPGDSLYKNCEKELVQLKVNRRPRMVKRMVGLPGDTIEIRRGTLYVNNKPIKESKNTIKPYRWQGNESQFNRLQSRLSKERKEYTQYSHQIIHLSNRDLKEIGRLAEYCEEVILQRGVPDKNVFPFERLRGWNADNMGPIYLPRSGDNIEITPENISLYKRKIEVFENNPKITVKGNYVFMNNIPISSYTFKLNYYWTIGDNRPNSLDSRYWGAVPQNHIVGKINR
ncbi:signal peptidase I [Marinilabiliaceae bacterium ANBcel2]|nr:signal peptidase I [Marinilabiliaceae bacterium ANBcel2]